MAALLAAIVGAFAFPAPARAAAPTQDNGVRDREWFLDALQVAKAQPVTEGRHVVVAVIDTGVNADHADLKGTVIPGVDLFDGHGDGTTDPDGHGTLMAGLIAGHGHGDGGHDGMLGIDPDAKILPIAVSDGSPNGPDLLPRALDFALGHGAGVIFIAPAAPPNAADAAAVAKAEFAGAVLVAGVGSGAESSPRFPAGYPGVVGVAGTDEDGQHAPDSAVGPGATIAAPATDIVSTRGNDGYGKADGTDAAAAIVAGAAALVRTKFFETSGPDIVHRLTATAADKGAPGRDNTYGYGLLDITAALTGDLPSATPSESASPSPTSTPPASPSPFEANPPPAAPSAGPDRGLPVRIGLALGAGVVLIGAGLWILSRRRT